MATKTTSPKPPISNLEVITKHFNWNLTRVESLTQLNDDDKDTGAPRADVLRAAVVLLHAAMEDLMRSALVWKLPIGEAKHLKKIMFIVDKEQRQGSPPDGTPEKEPVERITLVQLRLRTETTTKELIHNIVMTYMNGRTFNNVPEIVNWLPALRLDAATFTPLIVAFDPMMKRRHQIVHRSDRLDPTPDEGKHGVPQKISTDDVVAWTDSVRSFGDAVMLHLATNTRLIRSVKREANPL